MKELDQEWHAGQRTPEDRAFILDDSVYYEIIAALGVTRHDESDYAVWEHLNFSRMGHARGLIDFFEHSKEDRERKSGVKDDDVVSEDFGFQAKKIPMPEGDKIRLNKDLFHLTYSRLRFRSDAKDKPWPHTILHEIHKRCVEFIKSLVEDPASVGCDINKTKWMELLRILESGRELCIASPNGAFRVDPGDQWPNGLSCLTEWKPAKQPHDELTQHINEVRANAVANAISITSTVSMKQREGHRL